MNETASPLLDPSVEASYRLLRESAGMIRLPRKLVELRGEDRSGWLQGQATNDLRNIQAGAYMGFCLCKTTGQIEAICGLWALPDRLAVISDEAGIDVLLDRVRRMVILENVRAEVSSEDLVFVQGPHSTSMLSELLPLPQLNSGEGEIDGTPVTVLRSNKTGFGGWGIVFPRTAANVREKIESIFPTIHPEAYRVACLEFGTPAIGVDVDAKTLPPELGTAFTSAYVNYKKGCYMGQEVLMRIYSRGHTNRTWFGMYLNGPVQSGNPIFHPRQGEVGQVTSFADSPDMGYIAAGFVRREVAYNGEVVMIKTADGEVEGELQEMPLLQIG